MSENRKTREDYREEAPFSIPQTEKDGFFEQELKRLTEHHRRSCQAYDDICNGLSRISSEEGPYLPVSLFKDLQLRSVPEDEVVRQVTSSGTSGQQVSRIFLDAPTAELQRWALCSITGDFIGSHRLPMLIIDSPDVLRDRRKFSARGAGILGFSMMSSRRYYALDEHMQLDWDSIDKFIEAAGDGPCFAFGFTFMIWAYFYQALRREGRTLDLKNCYLIHGGGWKKLQDEKVSDAEFRRALAEQCGIEHVSDYYGMAEQTGSIFMQCDEGHLHASIYSDIEVLDPIDFSPCQPGQEGLLALRSWIPGSYPGHRLLTEDWGRLLGTDDCPCGRKGRYFEISGRIKKAEIRGCSDTFAADAARVSGAAEEGADSDLQVLAGAWPVKTEPLPTFDPLVLDYLEELSQLFMKDRRYRQYPDIYALGFWCRRAHMQNLARRQQEQRAEKEQKKQQETGSGRGLVLHIAPSNMPTMFAYSWITGLLAGNAGAVRLSGKDAVISDTILEGIASLLDKPEYLPLKERNVFLRFPRGHRALETLSEMASARMIWGGDETVRNITSVPKADGCLDIPFPDKYSIALLDADKINEMTEEELRLQANLFCRDTYGADQNACSSPRSVFWMGPNSEGNAALEKAKERWWDAVAEEAKRYELLPWMATEKYRMLCRTYAELPRLGPAQSWTNRLYVVPCGSAADWKQDLLPEAKLGLFFEFDLRDREELMPLLKEKIQTVVCVGADPDQFLQEVRESGAAGVDRAVSAGQALEFDTVWDRKDLIGMLSE